MKSSEHSTPTIQSMTNFTKRTQPWESKSMPPTIELSSSIKRKSTMKSVSLRLSLSSMATIRKSTLKFLRLNSAQFKKPKIWILLSSSANSETRNQAPPNISVLLKLTGVMKSSTLSTSMWKEWNKLFTLEFKIRSWYGPRLMVKRKSSLLKLVLKSDGSAILNSLD